LSSPIETVLLDAGGVLLDLDFAFLRRLLDSRGLPVELATLARAEALARTDVDRRVREGARSADAWRDYFRVLLSQVGAPVEMRETVIDTLWDAHQRFGIWTVAVEGSRDAVLALRALGVRVGVVSNAEGRVARDLDAAGYDGLFDTVVDSHLVGVAKPDPAIFQIALEKLAARPDTTVYLGDVPAIDVAGARAANITPILLDRFDLYPDADVLRLRTMADLPPWLGERAMGG
jgi:putative hydrolase of the HAD superfamily